MLFQIIGGSAIFALGWYCKGKFGVKVDAAVAWVKSKFAKKG